MSNPDPTIEFWTNAPEDAPEVRGGSCYFRPARLQWQVTPRRTWVNAHGPATRAEHRQGSKAWSVEGYGGDERPPWLLLPIDALTTASLAVRQLAREVDQ